MCRTNYRIRRLRLSRLLLMQAARHPSPRIIRTLGNLLGAFMNCYYHHDKTAVCLCRSCGRGLCPDCAVDLDRGLACRGRCEEDVRRLISTLAISKRVGRFGFLFFCAIGVLFVYWGYASSQIFTLLMGASFLFMGALVGFRSVDKRNRPK
jgi:hypothetical protein